jgi:hypothetical protein
MAGTLFWILWSYIKTCPQLTLWTTRKMLIYILYVHNILQTTHANKGERYTGSWINGCFNSEPFLLQFIHIQTVLLHNTVHSHWQTVTGYCGKHPPWGRSGIYYLQLTAFPIPSCTHWNCCIYDWAMGIIEGLLQTSVFANMHVYSVRIM